MGDAMDTTVLANNQLLDLLSPEDYARIAPYLTQVDLPVRKQLEAAGETISQIYFPQSGIVSVLAQSRALSEIEVGLIGREGMTGLAWLLQSERACHKSIVQTAGTALRIRSSDLARAVDESPALHRTLLRYAHTLMLQLSFTAFANGRQSIEKRLARWLLMAYDRGDGPSVPLTHEALAVMLGVRRPGVTSTLQHLHQAGLIDTSRGHITIASRHGLEELADGSYGVAEAEYRRLFADPAPLAQAMSSAH